MDIVLFDSRYPVFEIEPGFGMYPIEGVIATIEVKSRIGRDSLHDALQNCLSVMRIGPSAPVDQFDRAAAEFMRARECDAEEATQLVREALAPETFIFGYSSELSCETLNSEIEGWYGANGRPESIHNVLLPKCIVAGSVLALQNDGWLKMDPGPDVAEAFVEQFGTKHRLLFGTWKVSHRFGWLAIRLLAAVSRRFRFVNTACAGPDCPIEFVFDPFTAGGEYFSEEMEGRQAWFIARGL